MKARACSGEYAVASRRKRQLEIEPGVVKMQLTKPFTARLGENSSSTAKFRGRPSRHIASPPPVQHCTRGEVGTPSIIPTNHSHPHPSLTNLTHLHPHHPIPNPLPPIRRKP